MIYYNSRYLSQKLQINLAKWKRWVREFLPPDPLGGIQSGVTRQFNTKDAFKVYFAGYLVGTLKFTIPDASQTMTDLSPWLKAQGFFQIHARLPLNGANHMANHYLFIHPRAEQQFVYCVRTVASLDIVTPDEFVKQETYSEIRVGKSPANGEEFYPMCGYMIALTRLYTDFLEKIASEN